MNNYIAEILEVAMKNVLKFMVILLLISCSQETEDTRSIEQIYKEEGVPIRTKILTPTNFRVERSYNAVLTGIEESFADAKVGDKVEKVYVKVGDYVKKDQILLTFPTNNPNAQYFQAKVGYDNAKLAYERISNMYQTGGISKQQLDNAKANYDVASANWDAAQQSVIVKAPISGYVTSINVRETDNVKKEAKLFTISKMDKMKARVWISEKDVREISRGNPAYAVWGDVQINGSVVEVDMAINQQKQAFGAVVVFDNPKKILKFGITVDVHIETYQNPEALVVELKDLVKEKDEYFVYTIENNQAVKKPVRLAKRYKLQVEIADGLKSGDEFVTEGQMLLEPGAKIRIIE
jgi:RND family efflux transporter MFP subunit